MQWKELTSLVGSIHTRSLVARPTSLEQCREALAYCRRNNMTICARGAGRGYGDLALLLQADDGRAVLASAKHGDGTLAALTFSDRVVESRMGGDESVVPDPELRRVFDLEFSILRGLVEDDLAASLST